MMSMTDTASNVPGGRSRSAAVTGESSVREVDSGGGRATASVPQAAGGGGSRFSGIQIRASPHSSTHAIAPGALGKGNRRFLGFTLCVTLCVLRIVPSCPFPKAMRCHYSAEVRGGAMAARAAPAAAAARAATGDRAARAVKALERTTEEPVRRVAETLVATSAWTLAALSLGAAARRGEPSAAAA